MNKNIPTMRFSSVQPAWSRWSNGWLISMTSMQGYEMVQYPGEMPFVMLREDYLKLPEHHYVTSADYVVAENTSYEAQRNAVMNLVNLARRNTDEWNNAIEAVEKAYEDNSQICASDGAELENLKAKLVKLREASDTIFRFDRNIFSPAYLEATAEEESVINRIHDIQYQYHVS